MHQEGFELTDPRGMAMRFLMEEAPGGKDAEWVEKMLAMLDEDERRGLKVRYYLQFRADGTAYLERAA